MSVNEADLEQYRQQLTCNFEQIDHIFADCMTDAAACLSPSGIKDYLDGASLICMIGRGVEPVLVYLEEMPQVAQQLGESTLSLVSQTVWKISRSPNGKSIPPFLQTVAEAARRLGSSELLERYCELVLDFMETVPSAMQALLVQASMLGGMAEKHPMMNTMITNVPLIFSGSISQGGRLCRPLFKCFQSG